jgi:hypothetical protein
MALAAAATALTSWTSTPAFSEGLWQYCYTLGGPQQCVPYDSADCNAAFQATRAFSIAGIALCALAACLGVALWFRLALLDRLRWAWVLLCLLATATTLACWICWNIRNEDPACYSRGSYGTSYVLQCIAFGFAFLAALAAFLAVALHNRRADPPGPKYDALVDPLDYTQDGKVPEYPEYTGGPLPSMYPTPTIPTTPV